MSENKTGRKAHTICMRIEPELFDIIDSMAKAEDRPYAYIIRRMLKEWADKKSKGAEKKPKKKR